jgi:hypothetical protein
MMQGKLAAAVGFAVGYVLGSRAGRQRYEEIVAQARRVWGSQTVQSTAGVVQGQANDLLSKAKSSDLVNKAKSKLHMGEPAGAETPGYTSYETASAGSADRPGTNSSAP